MSVCAAAITDSRRQEIEAGIEAEIDDAFTFAETTPFPDVGELTTNVYA